MKALPFRYLPALCCFLVFPIVQAAGPAGPEGGGFRPPVLPPEPPAKPGLIQTLTHVDFSGVTSITLSPDGRHAYAAAFHKGLITLMNRQPATGKLEHVKSITGDHYAGAVAFRLSPDGKWGAASAFRSEAVLLFSRNPETGELTEADHWGGADRPAFGLEFCVDNVFSPDGKFLYTVGANSITCFKVENGKLTHVESRAEAVQEAGAKREETPEDELQAEQALITSGGRGIAITPDGKLLLASWNGTGTLTIHRRDPETGKLSAMVQALSNGIGIDKGLAGVMHVTVSPGGDFAYTAGGRFGRENGVCVFSIDSKTGRLAPVQSLTGDDLPKDFDGGNEIAVSPDGLQVAVACTLSDRLSRFSRDPATGRLTAGDGFACGPPANPGACGVTYDSTGGHLLVADENSSSIVAFRNLTR
jgi:6-phosphogluconolactonase (cycloisomerase 2 family)